MDITVCAIVPIVLFSYIIVWVTLRYTFMRKIHLTSFLFVIFGLFCVLSAAIAQNDEGAFPPGEHVVPTRDKHKFVRPNDVILPVVKYDSNSEVRNPFKSGVSNNSAQDGVAPLERYELKAYKLTAIVNDQQGSFRGNLVDPNGMGHLAVVGTKVGKKGGQVTIVEKNRLVVTEKYVDANGKEQVNTHEYKFGK